MIETLLGLAVVAQCSTYSVACQCGPSIPFEGFQMYVVEKCDGQETWHTDYGLQQYDSKESCTEAIKSEPVCQNL